MKNRSFIVGLAFAGLAMQVFTLICAGALKQGYIDGFNAASVITLFTTVILTLWSQPCPKDKEPDVMKPDSTTVFSFPMKAPKGAVVRDDIDAIKHLELWAIYQEAWCEHKPSVTINVKEHEWMNVGAWVYDHFDEMSGVSFLPHDGGSYCQAPYEEISQDLYEAMLPSIPKSLEWDSLVEMEDNVEGVQTLACTSGSCEI